MTVEYGKVYNIRVKALDDYHGLRQITKIDSLKEVDQKINLSSYLLNDSKADLSDPRFHNEVISKIEGLYKRGYFYYGHNRKIKLYVKEKKLKPENNSHIILQKVRIGYYNYPELVIEKKGQIKR